MFPVSRAGRVMPHHYIEQPVGLVNRHGIKLTFPLSIITSTQMLQAVMSEELSTVFAGRRISVNTMEIMLHNFCVLQKRLVSDGGRIPSVYSLFVFLNGAGQVTHLLFDTSLLGRQRNERANMHEWRRRDHPCLLKAEEDRRRRIKEFNRLNNLPAPTKAEERKRKRLEATFMPGIDASVCAESAILAGLSTEKLGRKKAVT